MHIISNITGHVNRMITIVIIYYILYGSFILHTFFKTLENILRTPKPAPMKLLIKIRQQQIVGSPSRRRLINE